MDAQSFGNVSPKIFDYSKILKIHEKDCEAAKFFFSLFYVRENAVYVRENTIYVRENAVYVRENAVYVRENAVYVRENAVYVRENADELSIN